MPELQHKDTETIEVEKLIPYANNPKEHPEEQVNEIASSIKNYGFVQPIVTDADNEIIIGHGRLEAAKKLGLDEVPVIKHEDITEAEAQALRLADNKIADTGMEQEKLAVELDQLTDQENYDELVTGFTEERTSEILDEYREQTEGELEEPDTPEMEEVETDIQEGDVYELGDHRLMCGDATSEDQVETLMNGEKADMVFTDPPYGMFLDTDFSGMKGIGRGNSYEEVKGDHEDFEPELITSVLNRFRETEEIFLWGADYYAELIPDRNSGSFFVWDKMGGGDGPNDDYDKMFGSNFETCWSKQSHKRALVRILWKGIFGLSSEDTDERVHPTQKPVKLADWFITRFSDRTDIIVDVYGGSGFTLLAAEQTNRECLMMELEPKYCQVIIDRWENLTGQQAQKVNNT